MKKFIVFGFLTAYLLTGAIAAQPEQSHNLSEIHPVDTDFNMSDRKIYNLSSLEMNDGSVSGTGLVLDDYKIMDQGNNYVLELDTANQQWNITGSDLNLNGNQLSNVGGTDCSTDEFIDGSGNCVAKSGAQDLQNVLNQGNSAGSYNIDVSSNDLNNVNEVDMLNTGVRIASDGSGNSVPFKDKSTGSTLLNVNDGGPVEVKNANLDLNSNAISNADWSNANDLNSNGGISDFSNANDLNSGGTVTDFSNANNLNSGGTVNDFSNANDLDSSGNVGHGLGATLNDGSSANQNIDVNGNNVNSVNRLDMNDRDSDGNNWRVTEDGSNGHLNWVSSGGGGTQMDLEHNGNLRLEGSITEGASLDLAENMKKRNKEDKIRPGDVVGVKDGEVTRNTSGAALNMVVSASPGIVLGGKEIGLKKEERKSFEESYLSIAYTGRVPVKVKGEAEEGDYLLPSGENDGTAVAVPEQEISFKQYRNSIGVVLGEFEVPGNVNNQTAQKYEKLLEKAEEKPYSIYNVAVGVK